MSNNPPGKIKTPTPTPMIMTKPPDNTHTTKGKFFRQKDSSRIIFSKKLNYKRSTWEKLFGKECGDSFGGCMADECAEMDRKYWATIKW